MITETNSSQALFDSVAIADFCAKEILRAIHPSTVCFLIEGYSPWPHSEWRNCIIPLTAFASSSVAARNVLFDFTFELDQATSLLQSMDGEIDNHGVQLYQFSAKVAASFSPRKAWTNAIRGRDILLANGFLVSLTFPHRGEPAVISSPDTEWLTEVGGDNGIVSARKGAPRRGQY